MFVTMGNPTSNWIFFLGKFGTLGVGMWKISTSCEVKSDQKYLFQGGNQMFHKIEKKKKSLELGLEPKIKWHMYITF
jgi:hypothetical protein